MNRRAAVLVLAAGLLSAPAWAVETIVTHEETKTFFSEGRAQNYDGQYEYTYEYDPKKETLVRTRIYDWREKKITPDDTRYQVFKDLYSHPATNARYGLPPVIRAVAKTENDAVELLVIEGKWAQSSVSTANRMVYSRARRLK